MSPDELMQLMRDFESDRIERTIATREEKLSEAVCGFANDFPDPVLAEALKVLGYVNRFGRGVAIAQHALARNGNPAADFSFDQDYVLATIRAAS